MPNNREIYHKPCKKCKSKGFSVTKSKRKCTKCDGQGWLTVDEEDLVCSSCDGDGKATHINERECGECKGKGNFPRVVEEVSIVYDDCYSCRGLGGFYSWICGGIGYLCDGEIYDDWDCKRCKTCERKAVKIITMCDECHGRKQRVRRFLKDIKTGEIHQVEEWAPKEEDGDQDE